jgi:hypothetical protein
MAGDPISRGSPDRSVTDQGFPRSDSGVRVGGMAGRLGALTVLALVAVAAFWLIGTSPPASAVMGVGVTAPMPRSHAAPASGGQARSAHAPETRAVTR